MRGSRGHLALGAPLSQGRPPRRDLGQPVLVRGTTVQRCWCRLLCGRQRGRLGSAALNLLVCRCRRGYPRALVQSGIAPRPDQEFRLYAKSRARSKMRSRRRCPRARPEPSTPRSYDIRAGFPSMQAMHPREILGKATGLRRLRIGACSVGQVTQSAQALLPASVRYDAYCASFPPLALRIGQGRSSSESVRSDYRVGSFSRRRKCSAC